MATRRRSRNPVAAVLAWAYAALLVFPLYYVIVSSFKGTNAIQLRPFAPPTSWSAENLAEAWSDGRLGPALLNSIWITLVAELLVLLVALPAAYAIASSGGPFARLVERVFAAGLLIPVFATLVPTLLLSIALQLFQTRLFYVLFLPSTALPLSVILLAQFFRTIPRALDESARVDGAGRLRALVSIHIPLIGPGIATVSILNFLAFWNEYLFALVLLGPSEDRRTVQTALPTLVSTLSTNYGVLLAGCLITMIPVFFLYVALQRRVEGALLDGSVKD